jgi:hypothetical protein
MATLSTTSLNWLANQWEDQYKSAVLSGIVGDLAHKARGGYHISRQDQGSGNYSVTRPDDKLGPSDRAAAIDMTMSTADMKKCHVRLRDIWKNRANDPRMKYINAWNGWDGVGGAGRYDVVKGTVGTATPDHKWHIHLEIRRRYVNDMTAMKAILSMLKGESLATYQGTKPPVAATPSKPANNQGDDDVALTDADVKKIWDADYLPSGDPENPTWAAKTLIGYRLNTLTDKVAALTINLSSLSKAVAGISAAVGQDNVDEAAISAAIVADPNFVNALASAVVAQLPPTVEITPEEMATAVKTALRDGVAS